jgi:sortase A
MITVTGVATSGGGVVVVVATGAAVVATTGAVVVVAGAGTVVTAAVVVGAAEVTATVAASLLQLASATIVAAVAVYRHEVRTERIQGRYLFDRDRYPLGFMNRPLVYRPGAEPEAGGKWAFQPPPPSPWVRVTGIAGKTLVISGLLVLGLVVYQLWGTGIQTAQAQSDLSSQFNKSRAALVAVTPSSAATVESATTSTAVATTIGPGEPTIAPTTIAVEPPRIDLSTIKEGDPIGRIVIPQIGVDKMMVAGVARDDLKKGPGHFPGTALPGQSGNAAIAGHRTTFGAPFRDIDQLRPKDRFTVETLAGIYTYEVFEEPQVIDPTDVEQVIGSSPFAQLTLMACHPPYSARERIIVRAVLVPEESAPVSQVTPNVYSNDDGVSDNGAAFDEDTADQPATASTIVGLDGTPVAVDTPTGDGAPDDGAAGEPTNAVSIAATQAADEFAAGWFSDSGAWAPTIVFALLCAGIALGTRWLMRRSGKWFLFVPTAPFFLAALYFFYQNVSRLLPPNI